MGDQGHHDDVDEHLRRHLRLDAHHTSRRREKRQQGEGQIPHREPLEQRRVVDELLSRREAPDHQHQQQQREQGAVDAVVEEWAPDALWAHAGRLDVHASVGVVGSRTTGSGEP